MSPAFDLPMESDDSPSADSYMPDDMSALEATYQDTTFEASPQVEFFARELDRFNPSSSDTIAEQRAQIFELVDSFYKWTRRRADRLRKRQSRQGSRRGRSSRRPAASEMDLDDADDDDTTVDADELHRAEEEANTWDLLRRLLPFRYRDFAPKPKANTSPRTRKQFWDEFVLADSTAKERKAVLEWLQNSASHGPTIDEVVNELQENAERGEILAHGWLHTRHKIKLWKGFHGYEGVVDPNDVAVTDTYLSSNTTITQLDPDAITRQGRRLELQDEYFERAIWLGCFEMLRRGFSMAEIRDWCSIRTEMWRAATIAPLPLSIGGDEEQTRFDPASLVLWRRTCFATAVDGGTSDHDRAVHGLLAGDIASVEKVCKSWDDFLFAQYNAILRSSFESFLIGAAGEQASKVSKKLPAPNPTKYQGNQHYVAKKILEDLEADPRTAGEAATISKALQSAIIGNDLDTYIYHQGILLSGNANEKESSKLIPKVNKDVPAAVNRNKFFVLSDHENLRVLAHILIILLSLDQLDGAKAGALGDRTKVKELIIIAYSSFLRLSGMDEILPLYCSKLSEGVRYSTLSRNQIHITDPEKRIDQLRIMKSLGLDIRAFLVQQTKMYFADVGVNYATCEAREQFKILEERTSLRYGREIKADFFGDEPELVDSEDELIIRSLEWMMLSRDMLVDAVVYTIKAYKYFLKRMHLRAARLLANRIPSLEIVRAQTPFERTEEGPDYGLSWFEELKRFQFPDGFFDGYSIGNPGDSPEEKRQDLLVAIFNLLELESLVQALDAMETLASLASLTREGGGGSQGGFLEELRTETERAKDCMAPILDGWLLKPYLRETEQDFQPLREAYLPETVIAFLSCLQFAGTALNREYLMECMDIATLIAAQGSDLQAVFLKTGRMPDLVQSLTSCSKTLAIWTNENKKGSKGGVANSNKLRRTGWSRELFAIKP